MLVLKFGFAGIMFTAMSSKVELKLDECLPNDEQVWSRLGNAINYELMEEMKARYGPFKTIKEENVDEFLDEQFLMTKVENQGKSIQPLKRVFGKANNSYLTPAYLVDELFISRKKETLQGKYTEALKGVFGMSFYHIDVIDLNDVLGSEYYSLYHSLPLLYTLCSFGFWYSEL